MQITSTVPTILRVPHKGPGVPLAGVAIKPGENTVPDDLDLARARKCRAFADAEREGKIQIERAAAPETSTEPGGTVAEALALIATETDLDTLREWRGVEKRAKVARALDARLRDLGA
jgi:hypothetical protein